MPPALTASLETMRTAARNYFARKRCVQVRKINFSLCLLLNVPVIPKIIITMFHPANNNPVLLCTINCQLCRCYFAYKHWVPCHNISLSLSVKWPVTVKTNVTMTYPACNNRALTYNFNCQLYLNNRSVTKHSLLLHNIDRRQCFPKPLLVIVKMNNGITYPAYNYLVLVCPNIYQVCILVKAPVIVNSNSLLIGVITVITKYCNLCITYFNLGMLRKLVYGTFCVVITVIIIYPNLCRTYFNLGMLRKLVHGTFCIVVPMDRNTYP